MLSEPSGTEMNRHLSKWEPGEKSLKMLGWQPRRLQATPHDHALGSLHIFQTFEGFLEVVLADQKNAVTSLKFDFSQHCRLFSKHCLLPSRRFVVIKGGRIRST